MPEKSDRDAPWLDMWREFASYVIRLRHLNTLRFEFEHLFELKNYVITMNPILRSISRAGKAMVFNVYGETEWAQWEHETSDRMARRFLCVPRLFTIVPEFDFVTATLMKMPPGERR